MNSVVGGQGQHDAIVQVWLDGEMVLDLDNIRFRDVVSLKIDGFYFSTFFGCSGDQWNTAKEEVAFFDDFRIFTHILGDVNRDGGVDFFDSAPFVALLTSGDYQTEADTNEDGAVNFFDISELIVLLTG